MNVYVVKTSGLRWIVRKDADSSWCANAFADCESAYAYAEILAKSERPSEVRVFNALGQIQQTQNFPADGASKVVS